MNRSKRSFEKLFPRRHLEEIKRTIGQAEEKTSGEIVVHIIETRDKGVETIHDQALLEFGRQGLGNTEDKTGVLVLFAWCDREFYILADEGINEQLSDTYLNEAAEAARSHFVAGAYTRGICTLVSMLGDQLAEHFPRADDDVDELSNEVSVGR